MIDYSNDTLVTRAERGAALLNRDVPDWFMKIDTDELSLSSCYFCVFGQLYAGYYTEGENKFFGKSDDPAEYAAAHGFTLGDHDDTEHDEENWYTLTEAWIGIIEALRANSGTN